MEFVVRQAIATDCKFIEQICAEIVAANNEGIGIAIRQPEHLENKILSGQSIIAVDGADQIVGFCYIDTWQSDAFVACSGLIVFSQFRKFGLSRKLKSKAFDLCRELFPESKPFGLTTSPVVQKLNLEMGFRNVSFLDITTDDKFWEGCKSCVNYELLKSNKRIDCICTAMTYDEK